MDIAEAVAFARDHHRSVLATRRADGSPQLSPVVHAVDAEGRVMISTREPAMKVRNLRRDDRASLCVLSNAFFGSWAQLEGTCEIVPLPDGMPLLEFVYRAVAGEHPDWEEFRRAMVQEQRVVLRITPTAGGPSRSG
ncbi:MAG: PPOX class F420-dependent oxidoreductase [Acidimicrobiales bacterium]